MLTNAYSWQLYAFVSISSLPAELELLINLLKPTYNSFNSLSNDFSKFSSSFKIFSLVLSIAMSLPISTARIESCFSVLTQILRPQRVSMDFNRKSTLVLMAFNRRTTSELDLDEFIQKFSLSTRRIHFS